MRRSFFSQLVVICGSILATTAPRFSSPAALARGGNNTEATKAVPQVQETETEDDNSHEDVNYDHYDYDDDHDYDSGDSSSLGGTTTTLDDGTVMTYDDDGDHLLREP